MTEFSYTSCNTQKKDRRLLEKDDRLFKKVGGVWKSPRRFKKTSGHLE